MARLGLPVGVTDNIHDELQPLDRSVLRVHETTERLGPSVQVLKPAAVILLDDVEQLSCVDLRTQSIDLDVARNHVKRIVERLWVLASNLSHLLCYNLAFRFVDYSNELVDPP